MGMAAVSATLTVLERDRPYPRLEAVGRSLMDGIREIGARRSVPLHVQGLPMAFHVSFGDEDATDFQSLARLDATRYRMFVERLVDHGVWVARRGVWYVSVAHGEREVAVALERTDAALASL
jgi:glutamate-1-semialdehyde 2,1-aminomutase